MRKNIGTYTISNALYISPKIMKHITELCSRINTVGLNIAKEEVFQRAGFSDLINKIVELYGLMQKELGITEILDSSAIEKILSIKKQIGRLDEK